MARAAQYSGWVKAAPPAGDYVCCAEVWGHDGKVGAIHVFIFDPSGQVAYCRLFNSHHFGDNLPWRATTPSGRYVKSLFEDLQRDPKTLFSALRRRLKFPVAGVAAGAGPRVRSSIPGVWSRLTRKP